MGLLTKTVIVKWGSKNRKWYEQFGYVFTKNGDEFEVKVEQLVKNSNIRVDVMCDGKNCNNIYSITWKEYYSRNIDDKIYCNRCKNKKLEGFISFERWCIENNRQDILDRWDYELNNCLPSEIGKGTEKKYWFKCPREIHPSELKKICNFTTRQGREMDCKLCNSFAQHLVNLYGKNGIDLFWSDKNIIDPWKIDKNSKKKVYIKCKDAIYHEDSLMPCNDFFQGRRCSYCSHRKIHPFDSLGKILEDNNLLHIWANKNKKSSFEYAPKSNKKVWWKCLDSKHEDYERSISESNTLDFRCPQCSRERTESILQEKVRLYLENLNCKHYTILHENNCTIVPVNPKTNYQLPFDNEIKELKLICEVNGEQHYSIDKFHTLKANKNNTTPEYELYYQQLKDRYKRIKAIQQGYFYLEIPYFTDNSHETWKQLIDNKINEILNTTHK